MELTTETLAPYVGGQLEVQSENEGYIYRGEIASTVVEGGNLMVKFTWLAKGVGTPPAITGWTNEDPPRDYGAAFELYGVSNIGPSPQGGGDRLCLQSTIMGELTVLYPADGSKLERSRVEGLEASAAV